MFSMAIVVLTITVTTWICRIFKWTVFAGIFWGIYQQTTPIPAYQVTHSFLSPVTYIFSYSQENWVPLVAAIIFLYVLLSSVRIERIESGISSLMIGTVSLLDYFQIEVETQNTKQLEENGLFKMIALKFKKAPIQFLFGSPHQDEYTAKAVRYGNRINFKSDCQIDQKKDG